MGKTLVQDTIGGDGSVEIQNKIFDVKAIRTGDIDFHR
jgi:hypothetical protein